MEVYSNLNPHSPLGATSSQDVRAHLRTGQNDGGHKEYDMKYILLLTAL